MPVAIQLAHAERKASTYRPWEKSEQIPPDQVVGGQPVAPSAVPYNAVYTIPTEQSRDGLQMVRDQLKDHGVDAIHVSGGGLHPDQIITVISDPSSSHY